MSWAQALALARGFWPPACRLKLKVSKLGLVLFWFHALYALINAPPEKRSKQEFPQLWNKTLSDLLSRNPQLSAFRNFPRSQSKSMSHDEAKVHCTAISTLNPEIRLGNEREVINSHGGIETEAEAGSSSSASVMHWPQRHMCSRQSSRAPTCCMFTS